jgi:hypothetical protein
VKQTVRVVGRCRVDLICDISSRQCSSRTSTQVAVIQTLRRVEGCGSEMFRFIS